MRFKTILVLAVVLALISAQEPEIIDFTYTRLLEEANYIGGPKDKIHIEPDTKQLQKYQFPDVCDLQQYLKEGTDSSKLVDQSVNLDDYLQKLRDKILDLLKLVEEIKNSRSYLAEIQKHLDMKEEQPILKIFEKQLQSLASKQAELAANKEKIQNMTALLNSKINSYNDNPRNQEFRAISLKFDVENYISKINYLKDLKEESLRKAALEPHHNFSDYFSKLGLDLKGESEEIQFIDRYFQNMSHLSYLRDTANSLRDNIEVDRLNIQYKKSCAREKTEIASKSSTPSQIKETLDHLREKKKQYGNTDNKYCEGVALKLEVQIKRLLRAINWTYMCADGLEQLIRKKDLQIKKLQEIEEKTENFSTQGYDQYHDQYEKTKGKIKSKLSQIKDFTIDQYNHDPAYLDHLIAQTEKSKAQALEKLDNLPKENKDDHSFDQIKTLAERIKTEKAKFCHNYGPYEIEQRRLWFQVYSYEQTQKYSSRMRGQFIAESQKLENLEGRYKELSEIVIKDIMDNYLQKLSK